MEAETIRFFTKGRGTMGEYFILIGKQVLLLLMMMCVGYFCGKKKLFSDVTVRELNRFVALFVISLTAIAGM